MDDLVALEKQLLGPEVRRDAALLGSLIANDFVEFGSTGESFGKSVVMDYLPQEDPKTKWRGYDFAQRLLTPEVGLVTFKAEKTRPDGTQSHSLRSSLWIKRDGRWQITFHQGTPLENA